MSLQALKKELKGLRDSVKDRPLDVLLNCKCETLTDAELNRLLTEMPLNRIPSDIILEYLNREYGTSYKSIDELPEECPIEWRDPE